MRAETPAFLNAAMKVSRFARVSAEKSFTAASSPMRASLPAPCTSARAPLTVYLNPASLHESAFSKTRSAFPIQVVSLSN
jgi:hypothetical protein